MAGSLESAVRNLVEELSVEGTSLKKLRKTLISSTDKEEKKQQKKDFAKAIEKLCEEKVVAVDGDVVTRLRTTSESNGQRSNVSVDQTQNDSDGDERSKIKIAVEKEISNLPAEGLRLKKFRKPILEMFLQAMEEKKIKDEFAACLKKLCSDGVISTEGGMVYKLTSVSTQDDHAQVGNDDDANEVKIAIENEINKLPSEGLRLKKFRKAVLDQFPEKPVEAVKEEFAGLLDQFCVNGDISLESGILKRLVDSVTVSGSAKRKAKDGSEHQPKNKIPRVDEDVAKKELWKYGEQLWADGSLDNSYMAENPDGITRLFCGNLKRDITEEQLHNAIDGITHIKWMTDKVTREFYGSTFIEMKDPRAAAAAVMLDKTKLLGRPLKIYYCPPRPGDQWPPTGQGRPHNPPPRPARSIQEKPPGCRKLFCGNLAYEIDDDTICHFFKDCGVLTGLRWLTRKETGEFRGCAFVEFGSTEEADLAIELNGQELLGRPIRLDWDN